VFEVVREFKVSFLSHFLFFCRFLVFSLYVQVPMSNALTAFTLKCVRIEWFTPRDVMVAEYERQNQHFLEEDVYALYENAKKQDALEREASAAQQEADDNRDGAGGSDGTGGGARGGDTLRMLHSHDDSCSPTVKVDESLMRQLHKSMSDNERETAGHMPKSRRRSSFVDNTPAVLGGSSFMTAPSTAGVPAAPASEK
jgi:hypothetical protein